MPSVQLLHGDCLELMKDIPSQSVDFTLTDIPYNAVSRESNGLRNLDKGKADASTFNLDDFLLEVNRITKGSVCIFCGKEQFSNIYQFFANQNGTTRAIVWQKSNPSPMNGEYVYLSGVELAVWHKNRGGQFNARCKNTVFKYPNGTSKLHPTEKNHALLTELILDNSNLGQVVFDPCMGSGAHGIVALENGRNFIGIELDDKYFEIAKERIENHKKEKEK